MITKNSLFIFFIFFIILTLSGCLDKVDPVLLKDLIDEEEVLKVDLEATLKKLTKEMTFNEAIICGFYYQEKKDIGMAEKCYERALAVGGKQSLMRSVTLKLADINLTQGRFEKAIKYADDYTTLYPGDVNAKKADFIKIQARYLSTSDPSRDQKKTEETIESAKSFLKKWHNDEEYSQRVTDILTNSYNKLFESELSILETYIKQYNYFKTISALNAAHKRLVHLKEKLVPELQNPNNERLDHINKLEQYIEENLRFELSKILTSQNEPSQK